MGEKEQDKERENNFKWFTLHNLIFPRDLSKERLNNSIVDKSKNTNTTSKNSSNINAL